ncbi:MAG: VapB-type antitoxin [archaeon GB-1867-005]|nr:VapB-type antitoxin [Candidatus Culexmicrobium cathedralense]
MAVVNIDSRGRLTIPRKMKVKSTRAIIIPAGSFFIIIPIPPKPINYAKSWLKTSKTRRELKKMAEELAKKDAVKRAERRKQQ